MPGWPRLTAGVHWPGRRERPLPCYRALRFARSAPGCAFLPRRAWCGPSQIRPLAPGSVHGTGEHRPIITRAPARPAGGRCGHPRDQCPYCEPGRRRHAAGTRRASRCPDLKNLLVDEGKAAIEADFVGTHTGEFAGVAPTGRAVRVPYSVIYDLRGDQISKLRIYLPLSVLVEQITS